jgi:hypothetical protein
LKCQRKKERIKEGRKGKEGIIQDLKTFGTPNMNK